jgi:hypothetical protein
MTNWKHVVIRWPGGMTSLNRSWCEERLVSFPRELREFTNTIPHKNSEFPKILICLTSSTRAYDGIFTKGRLKKNSFRCFVFSPFVSFFSLFGSIVRLTYYSWIKGHFNWKWLIVCVCVDFYY